jgi:hypothetical protein
MAGTDLHGAWRGVGVKKCRESVWGAPMCLHTRSCVLFVPHEGRRGAPDTRQKRARSCSTASRSIEEPSTAQAEHSAKQSRSTSILDCVST